MDLNGERRLYRRYSVEAGILAVLGTNNPKLGKILDISKGGLAFSYKGKLSEGLTRRKQSDLVILFDDTRLNFNKGPFKFQSEVISDGKLPDPQSGHFSMRRCGIQFKDLTFYRKSWLDYFIRHHSIAKL